MHYAYIQYCIMNYVGIIRVKQEYWVLHKHAIWFLVYARAEFPNENNEM